MEDPEIMNIRPYKEADYITICTWWIIKGEPHPALGMMVENGTFVVELGNTPVMSLTVFKTQGNIGYLEGYISSPALNKQDSNELGICLWNYCFDYAKNIGIEHLIVYTSKPKLVTRYESLGMIKDINGLTALYRSI